MPRAIDSTGMDMSGYIQAPSQPMQAQPSQPPIMATGVERSRVMLASMPGLSSGPDAVLRQFRGGRAVPQGRLFVP